MSKWFHGKVKFLRQMDNGLIAQITEQCLVDAMSFTEAEARITAEIGEGMREVEMMAIAKSPIKEVVFYGDTDVWHKCKVQYVLTDEDTEKEKKVTTYLLVNSADVKEAYERCEEHLREMLVPFTIPKIEESPIIDVYDYQQSLRGKAFQNTATDLRNEAQTKADALVEKHIGAVDPTGGQAVAFEMTERDDDAEQDSEEEECAMEGSAVAYSSLTAMLLDFGLDKLALWQIEEIKAAASSMDEGDFLGWMDKHHSALSDDQATDIYNWCANDAAFDQDEEDGGTDLESRMEAAFDRAKN